MPRICFDVDEKLFKKFSIRAANLGEKKKDILVKILKDWVGG